jgi:hypothetical protein
MEGNRRDAYRVPFDAQASIELRGRRRSCQISDLSAGGLLLACDAGVPVGVALTVVAELGSGLAEASGIAELRLPVEPLSVVAPREAPRRRIPPGWRWLRCRNLATAGSPEYEQVARVVFAAERVRRAEATGADEASGMASTRERRDAQRPQGGTDRYGKGNVNPLFDE